MSNITHRYDITETADLQSTNFLFFTEGKNGKEDVLKIVQFAYVRDFGNKPIFNLGFGDFDMDTGEINGESMTDNGDVYKIFNTVLSTIPLFFGRNPQAVRNFHLAFSCLRVNAFPVNSTPVYETRFNGLRLAGVVVLVLMRVVGNG